MENNNNLTQKTISGVIWKFSERIGAQLVTLIVSIVLARILLPEDYGIVALVTIVITILNVFVTCGLGASLVQKKTSDQLDFSTVFYSGIVISLFLYMILFFLAEPIADFYNNSQITWILRIMGLRLPLAAINSVQQAYVAKKMIFRKFFLATLVGTISSGIVGIVMAIKGFGVWAIVAQYLTNVTIDTIVLFITVRWKPSIQFSFRRLKRLISYGWKLLVSGLLDTGYNQLRSLVIGKKYTPEDLAYYDKGNNFPSIIATNVNASISSVLFASMSKIQDDKVLLKKATRKSIKICSYLIFPCMVGLAVVAEPFVKVVLTDKWLPMVPYLQIMCFVYAFWPVHVANLEVLKAMGRSDLYLILEIIKKTIGVIILLITMWFGVFWMAMGMAINTVLSAFINAFPNRKLLNYSYREQFLDLLPNLLLCTLMGIPVFFMSYININIYLLLSLQVIAGILLYLVFSILFRNSSFLYLFTFIKKIYIHYKNKKYNLNRYISKNKDKININYDKFDQYVIIYDNHYRNSVCIGEVIEDSFVIKYLHFDVKRKARKRLSALFVSIFEEYEIVKIILDLDDKSMRFLKKNNYEKMIINNSDI